MEIVVIMINRGQMIEDEPECGLYTMSRNVNKWRPWAESTYNRVKVDKGGAFDPLFPVVSAPALTFYCYREWDLDDERMLNKLDTIHNVI